MNQLCQSIAKIASARYSPVPHPGVILPLLPLTYLSASLTSISHRLYITTIVSNTVLLGLQTSIRQTFIELQLLESLGGTKKTTNNVRGY